jgi:small subunit ribosomal protein S4
MVKVGDSIEVRSKSKQLAVIKEATESAERDVPDYIEIDHTKLSGGLKRIPKLADVPYAVQMEPNLVIEFYSR